ncbi:MAG: hypothetical protein M0P12_12910 [Paludibacteraceae bacterium]|nr:hypothetical protein [Paludibacteraceae bacterium]
MKNFFKFLILLLPLISFVSCDDDEKHNSNLKSYVFNDCVLPINDYVVLRDKQEVISFINSNRGIYERLHNESLDSTDLVKHLLYYYDSMFFRENGIVLRSVETTATIRYTVDNVQVSQEDDVLNIDISQIIRGDREFCSTILVECSQDELDYDIVWNIASVYEDE